MDKSTFRFASMRPLSRPATFLALFIAAQWSLVASADRVVGSLVQSDVTLSYSSAAPPATGFNASKSVPLNINLGVASVTGVNFSAGFSFATVGAFQASHKSRISIDHPDQLAAPGMATISFQQSGLSNTFSDTSPGVAFTAGADVFLDPIIGSNFSIPVNVLDTDLSIATSGSNSGALGSSLSDSDTASAGRVAVGIAVPLVDVGTAGATPTVTGTSTVDVGSSIGAMLMYHHATMPAVTGMVPVSLAGSNGVMVNLPVPGVYDFTLAGFQLAGTLTDKTVPGITADLTVLNNVVASRFLGISAAQQTTTKNYSYATSQSLSFSIDVLAVPEPSSIALAVMGLIGLTVFAMRRRKITSA